MVDLVNGFIKRTPVQSPVHEVMPSILEDEEDGNLIHHLVKWWEWYAGLKAKKLSHRVEEPS